VALPIAKTDGALNTTARAVAALSDAVDDGGDEQREED
jgi:hypothetical protein|tara:strand:- start:263 stop:376 length:114 start_codon:yes stop_codon:yes gene_type:complete